jgi:hypothetical protein
MRIALFVTCFNDALFPQTGDVVVSLQERLNEIASMRTPTSWPPDDRSMGPAATPETCVHRQARGTGPGQR